MYVYIRYNVSENISVLNDAHYVVIFKDLAVVFFLINSSLWDNIIIFPPEQVFNIVQRIVERNMQQMMLKAENLVQDMC